jgi:hypothetical protein
MLYLIESSDYYKIGYASDIDRRLKQYNTHNPDYIVLDIKEGDTKDEALLHRKCKEFRIKGEWFEKCADVLDVWYTYEHVSDIHLFSGYDLLDISLKELLYSLLISSTNNIIYSIEGYELLLESGLVINCGLHYMINPYIVFKGDLKDRIKILQIWESY